MTNLILTSDSYKYSHFKAYNPEIKKVFSYIESRGGEYTSTTFFGLQYYIKKYLLNPITSEMIDEAEAVMKDHGVSFNREGWEKIVIKHNGYLPIIIKAVPEGMDIPTHNVLVTIMNTDPEFPWLPSFIETSLLRSVWYPTTVATISKEMKKTILPFLEETGTPETIYFKLHDFGCRGVSSEESAGIGGLAHLVNFKGSDTVPALTYGRKYYHSKMPAFSIDATEHSVSLSYGDNEIAYIENIINNFGADNKIFAIVGDTYDIFEFAKTLANYKDKLIDMNTTLVCRPDSGDPVVVNHELINILWSGFGGTTNLKGYKVLDPHIRLIQGDGVNNETIKAILTDFKTQGFSADNIGFGCGGNLLQNMTRDTQKFAQKASAVLDSNDIWHGISKHPITDPGKNSKEGMLSLYTNGTEFFTVDQLKNGNPEGLDEVLRTVYCNGKLWENDDLETIRDRAKVNGY